MKTTLSQHAALTAARTITSRPGRVLPVLAATLTAVLLGTGFASAQVAPSALHGLKFHDLDRDGVRDPSEPGLPNWLIYIDLNNNGVFDPPDPSGTTPGEPYTHTDRHGRFSFHLSPAVPVQAIVREVMQPGWVQTTPAPIDPSEPLEVEPNTHYEGILFGNALEDPAARPIRIVGHKFHDRNENGAWDEAEEGLQGWTIYLDVNRNHQYDLGTDIGTITGPRGEYVFIAAPGMTPYPYLEEVVQPGWWQTAPAWENVEVDLANAVNDELFVVNFGNARVSPEPGVLSGQKFLDLNYNGQKENNEPGLPDWIIYIDVNRNGKFDGISTTNEISAQRDIWTRTDENGKYSFTLRPGNHIVREVQRPGWTQSLPSWEERYQYMVELPSGGEIEDLDFGNYPWGHRPGILKGLKFRDLDGNGAMDPGEPGLAGWTIYLDLNGNGRFDFGTDIGTTTANDGSYAFRVAPGVYKVRERCPKSWTQTLPDASMNYEYKVEVRYPGHVIDDLLFGNYYPYQELAVLSGRKLKADSSGGTQEPLPGWTIYLDLNGNRQFDPGEDRHTVTANDGSYAFKVAAGDYVIREVRRYGWRQLIPGEDENYEYKVTVVDGQQVEDLDFVNEPFHVPPGVITGTKYLDRDRDGERDNHEPGLRDWIIYLDMNGNGRYDGLCTDSACPIDIATRTDEHGNYRFRVRPGRYIVREVLRPDWEQTEPGPPDYQHEVMVRPGEVVAGKNFGNYRENVQFLVQGFKFLDRNRNGRRDSDEPGLPGWRIILTGDDSTNPQVTHTDAHGYYRFVVSGGSYILREDLPDGWVQTLPGPPDYHYEIHLPFAAEVAPQLYNFGNVPEQGEPGILCGVKWHDLNMNGIRERNEPPLDDWTVYLDFNHNGVYDPEIELAATTNHVGYYEFQLPQGEYVVREVFQPGWKQTLPGSDKEYQYEVDLESGQTIWGLNFGNVQIPQEPGVIKGLKYEDRNLNGRRDPGERPLGRWLIYLDLNNNNRYDPLSDRATWTGNTGEYKFLVRPGTYTVREQWRPGWIQTQPDALHEYEYLVTVPPGGVAGSRDFGNHRRLPRPGVISGTKWNDLNGNGVRDRYDYADTNQPAEPGLPRWLIYVDLNENGVFDDESAGSSVRPDQWTLTDENGNYKFELPPGDYIVREVIKPGWEQTFPGPPSFAHRVTVPSGGHIGEVDFGNHAEEPLYKVEGWKFHDRNGNGVWDKTNNAVCDTGNPTVAACLEPGLPGWLIYLRPAGSDPSFEAANQWATKTDEHGHYQFRVPEGTYIVREVIKPGWEQTLPGPPSFEYEIEVPSVLTVIQHFNFGNKRKDQPAGVRGQKFHDVNGNGRKDPFERGLPGWTIYADLNTNGQWDDHEPAVRTGNSGHYRMQLRPGVFVIREVQMDGWIQTMPPASQAGQYKVRLRPGLWLDGLDFGNVEAEPGEIQGYKYYDGPTVDGDNVGLPGWTIYLDLDGDNQYDPLAEPAAVTDRSGHYSILVRAGTYTVREVLKEGWVQTFPDTPEGEHVITITPGSTTRDVDFKNKLEVSEPGVLKGRKLLLRPHAGDDVLDTASLSGLSGWLIYLDLNQNGQFDLDADRAVSTDNHGEYKFVVRPGTYVIRELLKPGWMQVRPGPGKDYAHVVTVEAGQVLDHLHFVNASLDRDGDSLTDYDEEIMGSDPFDSESGNKFRVTGNAREGLGMLLDVAPGRRFQVQTSPALTPESWRNVGEPLTADDATEVFLNLDEPGPAGPPAAFYRIKIITD